jgi:sec-independent protein translocase protein TatB
MFDVGWTEMLVIAIVMIVVVGPKDLPNMLRTFGRTTAKLRAMAGDFQKQFNDALKEAELDDVKKSVDSLRSMNPATEIRKQLNPFEKAAADVRAGFDAAMKPKPAAPAADTAQAAEPLKNGATQMPGAGTPDTEAAVDRLAGVDGPKGMPAAPVFPAMTEKSASAETAAAAVKSPAPGRQAAAGKRAGKPAPAKATETAPAGVAPANTKPSTTRVARAAPVSKTSAMAKPRADNAAPESAAAKKPSAVKKKTAGT